MVLFKVMFLCGALSQMCSVAGPLQSYVFVRALSQRCSVDGSLQSYVFVWSISPEVFCRWSPFKVMFL